MGNVKDSTDKGLEQSLIKAANLDEAELVIKETIDPSEIE